MKEPPARAARRARHRLPIAMVAAAQPEHAREAAHRHELGEAADDLATAVPAVRISQPAILEIARTDCELLGVRLEDVGVEILERQLLELAQEHGDLHRVVD